MRIRIRRDDGRIGQGSGDDDPGGDRRGCAAAGFAPAGAHQSVAVAGWRRAGARGADRRIGGPGAAGGDEAGGGDLRSHARRRRDGPPAGTGSFLPAARPENVHHRRADQLSAEAGAIRPADRKRDAADAMGRVQALCLSERDRSAAALGAVQGRGRRPGQRRQADRARRAGAGARAQRMSDRATCSAAADAIAARSLPRPCG